MSDGRPLAAIALFGLAIAGSFKGGSGALRRPATPSEPLALTLGVIPPRDDWDNGAYFAAIGTQRAISPRA